MGIPIVGLCDSDNITTFVDWVIPCNNKGRRSLALIFYLLAREYMMGRGKIASYDEFQKPLAAFEAEPGEETVAAEGAAAPAVADESVKAAVQEKKEEAAPAEAAATPAPAEKAEAPKEEAAAPTEEKHAHAHAHKKKEE
jgi:ribosomal protein S2